MSGGTNATLLLSSRARSGYKYVYPDPKSKPSSCKWMINSPSFKSKGYGTPILAATALASHLSHNGISGSKKVSKMKDTIDDNRSDWVNKNKNTKKYANGIDLFGARIQVTIRKKVRMGVVKAFLPQKTFVVVYDDKPDITYNEDLLGSGRRNWKVIDWEGDIWDTMDKRPICPQCAHPLGTGVSEWSRCKHCGFPEPGCSSANTLNRLRTNDPFRKSVPDMTEYDDL